MDLKIRDVAELLGVSETTIRRWLQEGKIPAYRLHHQYRFSRPEIENWMMNCKINKQDGFSSFNKEKEIYENEIPASKGWQTFSLFRAVHKGGIIINDKASTKEELIEQTTEEIAGTLQLDSGVIKDLLVDREKLMPTALNLGFAVPHTRDFLLKDNFDCVTIVFPTNPIDWGALDGQPIHTAFFLFAADDKHHLNLLAKLAHLSADTQAVELLRSRPEKKELLAFLKKWELEIQENMAK